MLFYHILISILQALLLFLVRLKPLQCQPSPGVFTVWNENFSSQNPSAQPTESRTKEEPPVGTENLFAQEFNFKEENFDAEMTRWRSNTNTVLADEATNRREGDRDPNTHLQYFNQEFQFNKENFQTKNNPDKIRKHGSGSGSTRRLSIEDERRKKDDISLSSPTTSDEYQDLVQLVEQLNEKFSRFKKFIRISDQEVDLSKKPTMQEVSITQKPTPQSRKRQHDSEAALEKPPLDLQRIKQRTKQSNFIKNKKNGKMRRNGHQNMPRFPNFPQKEKQKKRSSLGRSRVGDLPEFGQDNEDYPERMLSSIVYLSHGIRV